MKLVGQWFGGSDYGRPHADGFEHFSSLRLARVVVDGMRHRRALNAARGIYDEDDQAAG